MGLKPDHWIARMAREQRMIEPFVEGQVRQGVISYGVSSYGYDIRVADEFKIFTNVYSAVVDPKDFNPASMVDFRGMGSPVLTGLRRTLFESRMEFWPSTGMCFRTKSLRKNQKAACRCLVLHSLNQVINPHPVPQPHS